ncbi:dcm methylase, partial [Klebsiella pneumoniae]
MSKGTIIGLCDITGVMAEPWVEAGYRAVLVDPQ